MGSIDKATIEQIREYSDIVEVIGSYFNLQRAGSGFKAHCPFHKEKTASFTVHPDRQTYHCFGCGTGGDVFKFIQQHEGVEFPDAVRILGQRAGISVVSSEEDRQTQPIYACLEEACQLFQDQLKGIALRYARSKRKLTDQTIRDFRVGYAADSWNFLLNHLSKNHTSEELMRAGLILESDSGGRLHYYDRFRNRLMFPIFNTTGKVLGFMGRTLEDNKSYAKYVNSPETSVFKKGRTLYSLRHAQRAIYDKNQVIIVEGTTDALQCHQHDLENALAPLGTAFTKDQRDLLIRRFPTAEYVFMFDGDAAGRQAAIRISGLMMGRGNSQVCLLPEGEDPDSILRTGRDLMGFLESRIPMTSFYIDALTQDNHLDISTPEGSLTLLQLLKSPISDAPVESHGVLIDFISQKLNLNPESVKRKVLDERIEIMGSRVMWREGDRESFEYKFIRQLISDGKPETIIYLCKERQAQEILTGLESKHILAYLEQRARTSPRQLAQDLNSVRDPLFKDKICSRIVNSIAIQAFQQGITLDKQRLEHLLTSPLWETEQRQRNYNQRRFFNEKDKRKARQEIRRSVRPTLEEIEETFRQIKFQKTKSRLYILDPKVVKDPRTEDALDQLNLDLDEIEEGEEDVHKK